VRSECAFLNIGAQAFAALDEVLIQRLGKFWARRLGIGRPISSLSIGVQRELRNNQQFASDTKQAKIVFPVLVREDPERGNLFCQVFRIGSVIAPLYPEKHESTTSDLPAKTTRNRDPSFRNPLNKGAHN
jgi:hypothetical protein